MTSISESSSSHESVYAVSKNNNCRRLLLIWLDNSSDFQEKIDILKEFRLSKNNFQTFTGLEQCKNHIQTTPSQHRITLIIRDYFSQQLIPEIHDLVQISSIYIYCTNEQCHYSWIEKYPKVKAFYQRLDILFNKIRSDQSRIPLSRSDEQISISIFDSKFSSEQSTTGIDGSFVQYQLLIDCLLKMKTTSTDKSDFILKYLEYYKDNKQELENIDQFKKEYTSGCALWWYTKDTFLYRLLNKALRLQDIELLYLFGFFIRDLEQELRQWQYLSPINVYRSQWMSIEEVKLLANSIDQLISINSFFSTTFSQNVAFAYLGSSNSDDKLQSVLFEIEADPCKDGMKPFADLSEISWFNYEQEVLMMLGSIFRLKSVLRDEENHRWHIKMILCSDNDCDVQKIFHHMKEQYGSSNTRLVLFGNVLIDMAKFNEAEQYLERLLKQLPSTHKSVYKCYHSLGKISFEKGDYDRSLKYLCECLNFLSNLKLNDSRIAYIYNSMGEVYHKKGEIQQALELFEKALEVFQQNFTENHESSAWCYNNLGMIYLEMKNYKQASDYLKKALDIKTKVLPHGHPCLGNTYTNLGNAYYYRHEYDEALRNYKISYKIFKRSLNHGHPSIARVLKNIGLIYEVKQNFTEAKKIYEQGHAIRKFCLPQCHPDLIEIENAIKRVSEKIK
ncbi:unnamed protein product [Rotaria sp. Silwood1]|nr:unnamed protein product [Rotaria sp. Silwood1]